MPISYISKVNQRTLGNELLINNEVHIVGTTGLNTSTPDQIRLIEVPMQENPSSVIVPGYTEVTTSPGTNEFKVDYANGRITFNASQNGITVFVTYKGRGSIVDGEDINELQEPLGVIANLDGTLSNGIVHPNNISTVLTDNFVFPNDVTVNGDLTVNGTTTTVQSTTVTIADNILLLNSNVTGTPTLNAGLEIRRGLSPNVQLIWNETDDAWSLNNTSGTAILEAFDSGIVQINGSLKLADGSVSVPALAFNNETNSGLYRVSSGTLGISITGSEILQITSTGLDFKQNQALQFVAEKLGSNPISPIEGQIWYRTDTHQFMGYNGTTNVILG